MHWVRFILLMQLYMIRLANFLTIFNKLYYVRIKEKYRNTYNKCFTAFIIQKSPCAVNILRIDPIWNDKKSVVKWKVFKTNNHVHIILTALRKYICLMSIYRFQFFEVKVKYSFLIYNVSYGIFCTIWKKSDFFRNFWGG